MIYLCKICQIFNKIKRLNNVTVIKILNVQQAQDLINLL